MVNDELINKSIPLRYGAILNKLIELTKLLRQTLKECGVDTQGKEDYSFYKLLKCVCDIDSVESQVRFNNFKERRQHKIFTDQEEITEFLTTNKKLYYRDYVLLDKIIYYMTFLRWYLIQMKVPQYQINEATTLKSLILLLKEVKIYEPTSIIINGMYEENGVNKIDVRVNKDNAIDFLVVSDITGYDVPLYYYEEVNDTIRQNSLYTIRAVSNQGAQYLNNNIITPTNITTLPTEESYIIEYNGYGQYKASQIEFNAVIIENPYEIKELTVQNINTLSHYYQSNDEGYISDAWQINFRLENDRNIGISGKEVFFAIEEEEPFGSAISDKGDVSFIGQIPYVNNQYVNYEEYDTPDFIQLYITNSAPDYNKSKKMYISDEEYITEPLDANSIVVHAEEGFLYYCYQPSSKVPEFRINFDKDSDFENGAIGEVIYDAVVKENLILHIYTDFDPKYDTEEFYAINLYYEPVEMNPSELIKYKGFLNDMNVTLTFRDPLSGHVLSEDHIYDNEKIIINSEEYTIQNSQTHFVIPSNINDETNYNITLHPNTSEETTLIKTLQIKSNFILPDKNNFAAKPTIYYKPLGEVSQNNIVIDDNGTEHTISTNNVGKLLLTEAFSTIGTHNLILYTNTNDNVNEVVGYKYKISARFDIEEEYHTNYIKYIVTIFDNTSYNMGDYINYIQIKNENNENISLGSTNIIIQETQADTTEVTVTINYDNNIQGESKFIVNIDGNQEKRTFTLYPELVEDLNIQSDGNLIVSSIFANAVDNTELTTDLDFTEGSIYVLQTIITDPDRIDEVITEISLDNNGLTYKKIKDL